MRIARERYECPCRGGCPHPLSRAARGFAAASLLTFPSHTVIPTGAQPSARGRL